MHLPLIYRASALCSPKHAALRGCIGTQTQLILHGRTVEMHKTFAQQAVSGPAYADAPGTNAYRRCPWRSRRSTAARARGARRSAQAGAQAPGCRSARSSCSARSAGREILRGCRPSARRAPARGPHRHTRTARASPGVPPLCSGASVSSVSSASSVLIPVAQTGPGEALSNCGWIATVGEMGIFSPAAVPRRPRVCPRLPARPRICVYLCLPRPQLPAGVYIQLSRLGAAGLRVGKPDCLGELRALGSGEGAWPVVPGVSEYAVVWCARSQRQIMVGAACGHVRGFVVGWGVEMFCHVIRWLAGSLAVVVRLFSAVFFALFSVVSPTCRRRRRPENKGPCCLGQPRGVAST